MASRSSLEGDLDPARGSDRARAAAGARGREGRRPDRGALARCGRRTRARTGRVARGGVARSSACWPRRCSTSSPCCRARAKATSRSSYQAIVARARPGVEISTIGSAARGSGGRSAACSASRSRASRAKESGRSPRARATGRCAGTSPPPVSTRRSKSGGHGTVRAGRRASPRTSTGCRRTTTSTSRCSPSLVLEQHGTSFTSVDVAKAWLDYLPPGRIFTAERVACRNLLLGLLPPETATHHNPFREWIGARLRVDAYGWAAPGDPQRAARLAWEDAQRQPHRERCLRGDVHGGSARRHPRRGRPRPRPRTSACRSCPAQSRLAEAIRVARERDRRLGVDRRSALRAVRLAALGARDQQHGALVAAAMYHCTSFDEAIGDVVAGGWDTDTNGAAIGSIFGALAGAGGIDARWSAPLHDTIASSLPGFDASSIDGLRAAHASPSRVTRRPPIPGRLVRSTGRRRSSTADLDGAKIFAAPDDPAEWPAWRARLADWRAEARARLAYTGELYDRPEFAWTQRCFAVALVWLWDELLYDFESERFTPERLLDEGEREFGGFDGVVLWHAYPVIGIDERNQFDWYRDVPGLPRARRCVPRARRPRLRRLQPVGHRYAARAGRRRACGRRDRARARRGRRLPRHDEGGAEGAAPRARRDPPGLAFEGESTLPLARIDDHHLSWAQWFADSAVPGVIRARWFEQRHMLHHTRRWNRDHVDELHSSWLNGTGMLVWDVVFGVWVGWNERDRRLLRTMLDVQRRHAELLTHGEWTPLAARSDDLQVVGSRWRACGGDAVGARRTGGPNRSTASCRSTGATSGSSCRRSALPRSSRTVRSSSRRAGARPRFRRDPPSASLHPSRPPTSLPDGMVDVRRRRGRADGGLPPSRDGHVRRGALRRGVEAAAAAAARPRRGRPRPAGDGRFAIGVHEVMRRRRAAHERDARRGARPRRVGRRAAADRGRVAGGGAGRRARAARAARLELDRERAPRRPYAVRDPQGRLRPCSRRARTGTSTAATRDPNDR